MIVVAANNIKARIIKSQMLDSFVGRPNSKV